MICICTNLITVIPKYSKYSYSILLVLQFFHYRLWRDLSWGEKDDFKKQIAWKAHSHCSFMTMFDTSPVLLFVFSPPQFLVSEPHSPLLQPAWGWDTLSYFCLQGFSLQGKHCNTESFKGCWVLCISFLSNLKDRHLKLFLLVGHLNQTLLQQAFHCFHVLLLLPDTEWERIQLIIMTCNSNWQRNKQNELMYSKYVPVSFKHKHTSSGTGPTPTERQPE